MKSIFSNILIICDIEGSSGCMSRNASKLMTDEWFSACRDMSLDANAVATALFDAGVEKVTLKDFHRTGYNLLPELIDKRARVVRGYKQGPVSAIGDTFGAQGAMFIGMHSSSGSKGFLPHTMTSRISVITANDVTVSEVELVSAALASYEVSPVFFSGCPVACAEAEAAISGIATFPINKFSDKKNSISDWRAGLAKAAVSSLSECTAKPYNRKGPFQIKMKMRGGEQMAEKICRTWDLSHSADTILFAASDMGEIYNKLIRFCYLHPLLERVIDPALYIYNLFGKTTLTIMRIKTTMVGLKTDR